MIEGLIIKEAELDDLEEIAYLKFLDDSEILKKKGFKASEKKVLEGVTNFFECLKTHLLIARLEGEAVGYGIGHYGSDNGLLSDPVYVKEEHRRKGIGKRILKAQVDFAKDKGFRRIHSSTTEDNLGSMGMCKSLGFSMVDQSGQYLVHLDLTATNP